MSFCFNSYAYTKDMFSFFVSRNPKSIMTKKTRKKQNVPYVNVRNTKTRVIVSSQSFGNISIALFESLSCSR